MNLRNNLITIITLVIFLSFVGQNERVIVDAKENNKNKEIEIENGVTLDQFSYDEAVKEKVYVETNIDSDEDGEKDRVYVEIERPKESEEGMQVPIIYNVSSYNGGLVYPDYHDVDESLYDGKPAAAPTIGEHYPSYFVPRGYAVVTANNIGTEGSDGCPSTGGENEILAAKSVIDWLNGEAEAYTEDGKKVTADWSTGNVGMIGKSYDATIANGLAAMGVEGLKTIVPIAGISNWYDYYRSNGAVIAPGGYQGDDADRLARGVLTRENPKVCDQLMDEIEENQDRITGNYNEFWDERNYLKDVNQINASVFIVHGLNDVNVQRTQSTQFWEKLKEHDIPRKMLFHQGGHDYPVETKGEDMLTELNKWFGYWLYDIDNDIMNEPKVEIEHPDNTWEKLDDWPRKEAENKTFYLNNNKNDKDIGLSLEKSSNEESEEFTDDSSIEAKDLIENPFEVSKNRLAYVTPKLTESMNLSGVPELSIKASIDQDKANLSALLVDYGPEENTIVTRGWIDPRNKDSIAESVNLEPNKPYTFSWDMEANEYNFEKGHQIGLVIISSDNEFTKRPDSGTEINIYPGQSEILLPLSGEFPGEASIKYEPKDEKSSSTNNISVYVVLFILTIILIVSIIIYLRKKNNTNR